MCLLGVIQFSKLAGNKKEKAENYGMGKLACLSNKEMDFSGPETTDLFCG